MLRRQLLPSAWLTIALTVAALAGAAPVYGQDLTTDERIDRLERDLNMLQRQVYQGMPPTAMAGAPGSGAAVDLEVRMERLEQQMRDLTGRIEELGNQVGQLRQRIEQVNGDVDMRLGQAAPPPAAAAPGAPAAPAPAPPPASPALAAAPPYPRAPSDGAVPPPAAPALPGSPGGPVPIFGTLNPPGSAAAPPPGVGAAPSAKPPAPRTVATAAPPPHAAPAATLPGGSSAEQFDYAFKLVRKADYPAAEVALRAFVDQHPKDHLAGSAQYWLGETYFARGRYLEAASAFAEGYKRWPKSPKAADDLLKLGMSLARANEKQNACLAFGQLDHDFPHPGTAIRERAIAERHRLGC